MADQVAELRKKARHCRELARFSRPGVMRIELAKMAEEFCHEADKLEHPYRPDKR